MFQINDDKSIYVTRGDIVTFTVGAKNKDNDESYIFRVNDVVRIKVVEKKGCDVVVLQKDFLVEEETERVTIFLSEEDTRIGEVISKPTDYWYEIELNPNTYPQTIIGYDEDGAKIFKLYPEGKDLEFAPTPDTNSLAYRVEEHLEDTDVHITREEREEWNKNTENIEAHKSDTIIHVTKEEKGSWNKTVIDFNGLAGTVNNINKSVDTLQTNLISHNVSETAHNDIRLLIEGLSTRLNAIADSDDTTLDQMSEIVAYIKANKSLIESITTSKVNVSDIIDNLTTSVSDRPLSGKQGVQLKALIDAIVVPTKTSQLTNDSGFLTEHQDLSSYAKQAEVGKLQEEIEDYLPKNQGSANVGKILVVGTDGNLTLTDMPEGGTSGDVVGTLDNANNILLSGNLADGTYTLKYENEDGTYTEIGTLEVGAIVTYTITQNLTNVTSNNSVASVIEGESFTVNLTAESGYNMSTITVTMGGVDITSTAVSGGTISIAEVTGNIVITAVAEIYTPTYTNLFVPSEATLNKRVNSSYEVVDMDGRIITNFIDVSNKVPFTSSTKIYIKSATFTADGNSKLLTYKDSGTTYTNAYTSINGGALSINDEGNGVISISGDNIASALPSDMDRMCFVLKVSDSALTTDDIQNIVITIDEPIE